jgi:ABC-2 type transport system ATP-binding protein
MSSAVSVADLKKSYNGLQALRGVSFEIAQGEIFGLLGPNGAGKTTTVEILEGYRERDGGSVTVLGEDPSSAGLDWRERIGVVLQSSSFYDSLTVAENLALFAGYYAQPRPIGDVVELVGLEEKRDTLVRSLSGGQRRRLDLGLALVGDPEIVFLDEPTTGFDPEARRRAWQTIASLRDLGKTILLTTHYLEEAERLSDRVAVVRDGQIVALGPPAELTSTLPATEIRYRRNGQEVVLQTEEPTKVLHELTSEAVATGHELEGLEVRRASLEDVYLTLTRQVEQE